MLYSRFFFWLALLTLAALVVFGSWVLLPQKTATFDGSTDLLLSSEGVARTADGEPVAYMLDGDTLTIPLRSKEYSDVSPSFTVTFPSPAESRVQVERVSLLSAEFIIVRWEDEQTLFVRSAIPIQTEALPAIQITFPRDYLQLPLKTKIIHLFSRTEPMTAVGVGAVLLALGFIVLRIAGRKRVWKASVMRDTPPAYLTVSQVAVFHHSSISPMDFTALLLELARKGALEILEKDDRAVFIRKPFTGELTTYEQGLLALIFAEEGQHVDVAEVLSRLDKELFSAVASQLYIDIYASFRDNGYFKENPRNLHLRSKVLGIVMQLSGLVGLVAAAVLGRGSWLLGSLSVVTFLLGALYYQNASRVLPLSQAGAHIVDELASFMLYLTSPDPILDSSQGALFFSYLPYALVLDLDGPWLNRFNKAPIYLPQWLMTSEGNEVSPEKFIQSFRKVADDIAIHIAAVKDPNAD